MLDVWMQIEGNQTMILWKVSFEDCVHYIVYIMCYWSYYIINWVVYGLNADWLTSTGITKHLIFYVLYQFIIAVRHLGICGIWPIYHS